MSRFDKDKVDYDSLNLDNNHCEALMQQLASFVEQHIGEIKSAVQTFKQTGKDYSIIELSDSIVLVVKRSETNRTVLCVGYPFKIYHEEIPSESLIDSGSDVPISLSLHLRGKDLRDRQRQMLVDQIEMEHGEIEYVQIHSLEDFQKLADSVATSATLGNNSCVYVDPYNFIGDSIVGLYFLDYFVKTYGINGAKVITKAHQHTNFFYPSYEKTKASFDAETADTNFIIVADFIDNHFGDTMRLLGGIKKNNLVIFIVSRNLIIDFTDKKVKVYHYEDDDVLLRSESVQEYMDNALRPFALKHEQETDGGHRRVIFPKDGNILINPFSSDALKDLSPDYVKTIIGESRALTAKILFVSTGAGGEKKTEWIHNFQALMQAADVDVSPVQDKGLGDLADQIRRLNIAVALTVDTAVSHLLTRIGVPNITVYNDGFWDPNSPQSLSAESPLGFCSTSVNQIPAIKPNVGSPSNFVDYLAQTFESMVTNFETVLSDNEIVKDLRKFQKNLSEFFVRMRSSGSFNACASVRSEYYFLKSKYGDSPAGWIFQIYDPIKLLSGISNNNNPAIIPLVHSAWRVSPVNKIAELLKND